MLPLFIYNLPYKPDRQEQVTKWLYGTEKYTGSPATGSLIATGHLLSARKYATDSSTGNDHRRRLRLKHGNAPGPRV